MRIGIHNAEGILFSDPGLWRKIPDLTKFRDQWSISKMSPHLRQTGTRAILEFLDAVRPQHEKALSEYFGAEVTIDKAGRAVKNEAFNIEDHPPMDGSWVFTGFGAYRDGDEIKITFWR